MQNKITFFWAITTVIILLSGCATQKAVPLMEPVMSFTTRGVDGKEESLSPEEAKAKADVKPDGKIAISIHAYLLSERKLDPFSNAEINIAKTCTIKLDSEEYTLPSVLDVRNKIQQNGKIRIELYAGQVDEKTESINCKLKIIEDDGFTTSGKDNAFAIAKSLQAYVDTTENPSTIFADTLKDWVPFANTIINLIDAIFTDDNMETAEITLMRANNFMPSEDNITPTESLFTTNFTVNVNNVRFSYTSKSDTVKP